MSDAKEMPLYVSHKKVRALEIKALGREPDYGMLLLHFADESYPPCAVEDAAIQRYKPVPGDFFVQYEDGYRSISPRKAFVEGYTLADVSETAAPAAGPNFDRNTVVSSKSLVVDRNGKSWWVWPESQTIIPADVRK